VSNRLVTRFAPSPNGRLHLGHALSAITGYELAKRAGGRFLVRIEDLDIGRSREVHVRGIFEDLAWLGLEWEEPVLRQSKHAGAYAAAAGRLQRLGLLYPCFATRAEIAAATPAGAACDPDGAPLYPGLHRGMSQSEVQRRLASGQPRSLRLDMTNALRAAAKRPGGHPLTFVASTLDGVETAHLARPERWGDVVLVRKDAPASYHLAVAVDDARQGITHVVRGADLLPATDLHRLLQVLLELPEPRYHHHRLITDDCGRKLAKSAADTSLAELRAAGRTPDDVRRMIELSPSS
jgi:glutamyl-Q tRNA(Asp) synthetase